MKKEIYYSFCGRIFTKGFNGITEDWKVIQL